MHLSISNIQMRIKDNFKANKEQTRGFRTQKKGSNNNVDRKRKKKHAYVLRHLNIAENWLMNSTMTRILNLSHVNRCSGLKRTLMEGIVAGRRDRVHRCLDWHRTLTTFWAWGCMMRGDWQTVESLLSRPWRERRSARDLLQEEEAPIVLSNNSSAAFTHYRKKTM